VLLDASGTPRLVLQDGQRKSLTTDRVTHTLGPDHEVQTIREIFLMFLEQNILVRAIARILNERGLKHGNFGPWDHNVIRRILTHPKYTGCAVFNRYSEKLGARRLSNPRDQWVLRPNAFPAIVSQEVFDRAQDKLRDMVIRRSKDRLSKYGAPLPHRTSASAGMALARTYVKRSLGEAVAETNIITAAPAHSES
jgi:hypothetical protein